MLHFLPAFFIFRSFFSVFLLSAFWLSTVHLTWCEKIQLGKDWYKEKQKQNEEKTIKILKQKQKTRQEFVVLGSVILTAASKHSFRPAFVRALVSQKDNLSLLASACPSFVVIRSSWLDVDLRSKTKKTCWTF